MAQIERSAVIIDAAPLVTFHGSGAPTTTTRLGVAVVGSQYRDVASGLVYSCVATDMTTSVTWQKVGVQV